MNQILRRDWLPERARWSSRSRSGLPAASRKKIFLESLIINSLLTKLVRSRWLDMGLVLFFCEFIDLDSVWVHKLGQYPAIWIEQTWSVTHISLFFFKFCHLSALNINVTLIDGPGSYAGRVELNYSGSLCDTDLTIDVGHVICRQLGYPQAVAIPCCNAFGSRNNSFWLYDVKCKGNESSLAECDYKVGAPNVCFPALDFASVVCENPNITDSKFMIKAIKKTGQKFRR